MSDYFKQTLKNPLYAGFWIANAAQLPSKLIIGKLRWLFVAV